MNGRPNIVLVHGAWADGSCWSGVIERLQNDGYRVTAPQFPETSAADDVARLRQVLNLQDSPTIVAGHSYGGHIMTGLGTDAPNVAGLVYVAAYALDQGETLDGLLSQGPKPPGLANLFTDQRGFVWQPQDEFVRHFASGIDSARGKVLHAAQQPFASAIFSEAMGAPAWRSLPSWYLVATQDEALPPDAQRRFATRMGATVAEVPAGHLAIVSHPDETARLIRTAAESRVAAPASRQTRS
ncbi:alpha/beta hydrolase [Rugosimonospora acidiphila]|uniref:Alpha/beta hydrolase n=1 Tax=Rugosimonospora acidiphila TaxID=556531 RepID=A0ABP9SHF0_9ACTN